MRRLVPVAVSLAALVTFGACGGGGSKATPPSGTQPGQPTVTYQAAAATPSPSAKMVCEQPAISDIASAIGVSATRVTSPTWLNHLFSCTYVYPNGSIVLSVKELASWADTTAYFNRLATQYGKRQNINGLAQGAFIAPNDDVVVRKDYKVLLVNVQGISQNFVPASTRSDVAENIAGTIMACWAGA
jgi:hypothetical protein